jgi:PAS domain S-box-containing protein
VSGYLGIARDVTERREAEELLRKSEEKYRAIIEGIEEGYYEVDLGGNLTFCNDSMSRILGYSSSELIGTNYRRFTEDKFAEKVYDLFMKVYETGKAEEISGWLLVTRDSVTRNVDASVTPVRDSNGRIVGFRGICRDVTQVVALKKQLFQAQKMEAIGNLAGGIAHDFNNILNVALGFAELAQDDLEPGHPALDHIREVRAAGERGAHLVNQILTLSRETEKELLPISATHIVKEVLRFLRASMPTTVDIRRRLDAKHDTILADPTQLHQILMNLCTNAGHAMRQTGGILEVQSDDILVDETAPAPLHHMERGRFLTISVRDTGHGIPPELQERIFEPYFTTKRPGEGTGLGLAVVHGIVKNYGGHIAVQSEPDAGTTVEVFLPVVEDDFTTDKQLSEELPRGNESILYVDDEPPAVRMGKLTLERLGYTVVTATDSLKALELFRSEPERFDAVITDMTMPGLTGSLLADLLLATRSDIPIILCTGYTDLISEEKAKAKGIKAFLTKPVSRETLAKTLREVLDNES